MKAEKKTFAPVSDELKTTAAAAAFVENVTLNDIPKEAMRIGTRCVLDGLGLYVAGLDEHSVRILIEEAEQIGGRPDALLFGARQYKDSGSHGCARARNGGSCP